MVDNCTKKHKNTIKYKIMDIFCAIRRWKIVEPLTTTYFRSFLSRLPKIKLKFQAFYNFSNIKIKSLRYRHQQTKKNYRISLSQNIRSFSTWINQKFEKLPFWRWEWKLAPSESFVLCMMHLTSSYWIRIYFILSKLPNRVKKIMYDDFQNNCV